MSSVKILVFGLILLRRSMITTSSAPKLEDRATPDWNVSIAHRSTSDGDLLSNLSARRAVSAGLILSEVDSEASQEQPAMDCWQKIGYNKMVEGLIRY